MRSAVRRRAAVYLDKILNDPAGVTRWDCADLARRKPEACGLRVHQNRVVSCKLLQARAL